MSSSRRRAAGEGSIYQAGGYWVAAVSVVDPGTGKRRQRTAKRRTKSDARTALAEMQSRKTDGAPLRDSTVTLADWSRRWELTSLAASPRRATTKATYRTLLKTCVRPHLGALPLAQLRPSDVEGWLSDLEDAGRSPSTRRQALTILRACLEDAVRDGLLARNPVARVTRPKVPRREAEHYSRAQVAQLVAAAKTWRGSSSAHRLMPYLLTLLGTGMRRGEGLGLLWEYVDLELGELRVRGTLVRVGGRLVLQPPKTENGWRTIPLSPVVVAALRSHRRAQLEDRIAAGPSWIETPYVFTTEAGTPLDPRNVSRWFTSLTERAGVTGSLHTLRHTALTSMTTAGVPLPVVSRIAGHESITTTVDLYGHTSDQAARDAVRAAAAGLGLA